MTLTTVDLQGGDRAVALTRALLAFDTRNPPGDEAPCIHFLAGLLEGAGFATELYAFEPGRPSLVARREGPRPVCFTGHVDVVPLGETPWSVDPFAGETDGDRLYGRGTSDMKAGVAAMVLAAMDATGRPGRRGLELVITAGEERGCRGAHYLASVPGALGAVEAVVVGEPTGNLPRLGHKGLLWLEFTARGVTAHSSMPERGVNAIYPMAGAILALRDVVVQDQEHPFLGRATLNIGTCSGGLNVNSVPSAARFTVDLRTLPGCDHTALAARLHALAGESMSCEVLQDERGFVTSPSEPFAASVFELSGRVRGGAIAPEGVPYYTDGAALHRAYGGVPTVILGPGETDQAHVCDEYGLISRVHEAVELYSEILRLPPGQ